MEFNCPILEYDPERRAMIEPEAVVTRGDVPEHCVICFFQEVITEVVAANPTRQVLENRWEDGPHPLYETPYKSRRLAFFHPGVGAPISAGLLEEAIAAGCTKFIACGGCGNLEKGTPVGEIIIVSSAVRDEGVSYHYLPPSRQVAAHPHAVSVLQETLAAQGVPSRVGTTWTTDAPYRETQGKIARSRAEGCITVEMEAAALLAVAQFRRVAFGQLLYAGDDLSGEAWDNRGWQSRRAVRQRLFWLAADACLNL